MAYFNNFPRTLYSFGDGQIASIQNITAYSEIIDEIKANSAFYEKYHILSGERADQVAFKLYKDAELHWTFYMMNDNIRENGWPMTYDEVLDKSKDDFPGLVVRVKGENFDKLFTEFKVGQLVKDTSSGNTGVIVHRDLKLGQLVLEQISGPFNPDSALQYEPPTSPETIEYTDVMYEHLAPHHYLDKDGEIVDFDPFTGPGEFETIVTNLEHYLNENDKLKEINVLKPSGAARIAAAVSEAIGS